MFCHHCIQVSRQNTFIYRYYHSTLFLKKKVYAKLLKFDESVIKVFLLVRTQIFLNFNFKNICKTNANIAVKE